ncbi:hypothetical protein ACERIT_15205 (plasmid) [Halopenitus sp. H-Gu1]|uniref:hypothetical protein n=1 Tax=Halopenitus sp. H-Gu1 TaxID=3242697 RepID=UPI00359E2E6A
MSEDVSRRAFLGAAAAVSTLPAVGGTATATDGGDHQRTMENLTASGIFVNADLGKASFRAEPDDLEDIDVRVRYDYHDVIFSVEATNDASDRAGTLLELTPTEAEAIAAQLVEAAEEYRADEQEGR